MPNYVPFSDSNYETRPYGPVAGVDAGIQDIMARRAKNLDLQSMMTANEQSQANLDLFRGKMPNEQSISDLAGATARATNPGVMAAGNMGEAQKKQAEGSKAMQLLESDVAAGKAKNTAEAAASRLQQVTSELGMVRQASQMLDAAGPPGSPQSQGAWQQVLQQVPPELRAKLPQAYSPQVRSFLDKILVETPKHLQTLAEEAEKGKWSVKGHEVSANATIGAAKIAAEGHKEVARIGADAGNESKRSAAVLAKLAKGDASPELANEGSMYLSKQIEENPRMKSLSQMLMLDILAPDKGGTGGQNAGRIQQQMQRTGEELWNIRSKGIKSLNEMNPYKQQDTSGGLQAAAQGAWGSYDPAKYDYRMGPNGIQRKEK